ncbi:hypothetical protein ACEPAH_6196 [Sanghuangporus vaninii]
MLLNVFFLQDGRISVPSSFKVKKKSIDLGLIDLCSYGSGIQEPVQTQHHAEEAPRETSSNGETTMSTNGTVPETPSSITPSVDPEHLNGDIVEEDSQFGDSGEEYDEDELVNSPSEEGQTHTT